MNVWSEGKNTLSLKKIFDMNENQINRQVRLIGKLRKQVKENSSEYIELHTEFGAILIPKNIALKLTGSTVEHYKSKRETLKIKL